MNTPTRSSSGSTQNEVPWIPIVSGALEGGERGGAQISLKVRMTVGRPGHNPLPGGARRSLCRHWRDRTNVVAVIHSPRNAAALRSIIWRP